MSGTYSTLMSSSLLLLVMNIIEEVAKMIIGHTLLVACPHFINMILGVYMGPKLYACVPVSHDKKCLCPKVAW